MSYFHPQRMPVLPARRRKAARLQLEEMVRRSAQAPQRRTPVVVAAAIVVVMLSTGAAAAGVVAYHTITDKTEARCFTVARVHPRSAYFTTIVQAGTTRSKGVVRDALKQCRGLFAAGELKRGHPVLRSHFKPTKHTPHLVACVWPDGTAAIFPGKAGTCHKLGLQAAARR